jgi:hypothetical protein
MNCSQLYVGVDRQLDEVRTDDFSLTLVPSASPEAKAVRSVLGSRYVYYLAPHTGCGCGWDVLDIDTPGDDQSKGSCDALARFLGALERTRRGSKLYSVCIESLGTSPRSEVSIAASEFMRDIQGYGVSYASKGARVYVLGA